MAVKDSGIKGRSRHHHPPPRRRPLPRYRQDLAAVNATRSPVPDAKGTKGGGKLDGLRSNISQTFTYFTKPPPSVLPLRSKFKRRRGYVDSDSDDNGGGDYNARYNNQNSGTGTRRRAQQSTSAYTRTETAHMWNPPSDRVGTIPLHQDDGSSQSSSSSEEDDDDDISFSLSDILEMESAQNQRKERKNARPPIPPPRPYTRTIPLKDPLDRVNHELSSLKTSSPQSQGQSATPRKQVLDKTNHTLKTLSTVPTRARPPEGNVNDSAIRRPQTRPAPINNSNNMSSIPTLPVVNAKVGGGRIDGLPPPPPPPPQPVSIPTLNSNSRRRQQIGYRPRVQPGQRKDQLFRRYSSRLNERNVRKRLRELEEQENIEKVQEHEQVQLQRLVAPSFLIDSDQSQAYKSIHHPPILRQRQLQTARMRPPSPASKCARVHSNLYLILFITSIICISSLSLASPPQLRTHAERTSLAFIGMSMLLSFVMWLALRYTPSRALLTRPMLVDVGDYGTLEFKSASCMFAVFFLVVWTSIAMIVAVVPSHDIAVAGGLEIWNANLYFGTWVGFGLSCYLFADGCICDKCGDGTGGSKSDVSFQNDYQQPLLAGGRVKNQKAEARKIITRTWILLLIFSAALVSCAGSLLSGPMCFNEVGGYVTEESSLCEMLVSTVVYGVLGVLLSIAYCAAMIARSCNVSGSDANSNIIWNARVEQVSTALSAIDFVFFAMNAGFSTSPGIGDISPCNVYLASWVCFGLSFYLVMRHVDMWSVQPWIQREVVTTTASHPKHPNDAVQLLVRQNEGDITKPQMDAKSFIFSSHDEELGESTSSTSDETSSSSESDPTTISNSSTGPPTLSGDESEPTPLLQHYQPYQQYKSPQQRALPSIQSSMEIERPERPDPEMRSFHGRSQDNGGTKSETTSRVRQKKDPSPGKSLQRTQKHKRQQQLPLPKNAAGFSSQEINQQRAQNQKRKRLPPQPNMPPSGVKLVESKQSTSGSSAGSSAPPEPQRRHSSHSAKMVRRPIQKSFQSDKPGILSRSSLLERGGSSRSSTNRMSSMKTFERSNRSSADSIQVILLKDAEAREEERLINDMMKQTIADMKNRVSRKDSLIKTKGQTFAVPTKNPFLLPPPKRSRSHSTSKKSPKRMPSDTNQPTASPSGRPREVVKASDKDESVSSLSDHASTTNIDSWTHEVPQMPMESHGSQQSDKKRYSAEGSRHMPHLPSLGSSRKKSEKPSGRLRGSIVESISSEGSHSLPPPTVYSHSTVETISGSEDSIDAKTMHKSGSVDASGTLQRKDSGQSRTLNSSDHSRGPYPSSGPDTMTGSEHSTAGSGRFSMFPSLQGAGSQRNIDDSERSMGAVATSFRSFGSTASNRKSPPEKLGNREKQREQEREPFEYRIDKNEVKVIFRSWLKKELTDEETDSIFNSLDEGGKLQADGTVDADTFQDYCLQYFEARSKIDGKTAGATVGREAESSGSDISGSNSSPKSISVRDLPAQDVSTREARSQDSFSGKPPSSDEMSEQSPKPSEVWLRSRRDERLLQSSMTIPSDSKVTSDEMVEAALKTVQELKGAHGSAKLSPESSDEARKTRLEHFHSGSKRPKASFDPISSSEHTEVDFSSSTKLGSSDPSSQSTDTLVDTLVKEALKHSVDAKESSRIGSQRRRYNDDAQTRKGRTETVIGQDKIVADALKQAQESNKIRAMTVDEMVESALKQAKALKETHHGTTLAPKGSDEALLRSSPGKTAVAIPSDEPPSTLPDVDEMVESALKQAKALKETHHGTTLTPKGSDDALLQSSPGKTAVATSSDEPPSTLPDVDEMVESALKQAKALKETHHGTTLTPKGSDEAILATSSDEPPSTSPDDPVSSINLTSSSDHTKPASTSGDQTNYASADTLPASAGTQLVDDLVKEALEHAQDAKKESSRQSSSHHSSRQSSRHTPTAIRGSFHSARTRESLNSYYSRYDSEPDDYVAESDEQAWYAC